MLLVGIIAIATVGIVQCDLPVHCVKHQVVGRWRLQTSEPKLDGQGPLTCGHHVPDNQKTSYQAMQSEFKEKQKLELSLTSDNTAMENENSPLGRWTMVYDEGFEITY